MIETPRLLLPERWATLPAPASAPQPEQLTLLRLENAALRAQNAALQARIRGLEARLGQEHPFSRAALPAPRAAAWPAYSTRLRAYRARRGHATLGTIMSGGTREEAPMRWAATCLGLGVLGLVACAAPA